jgi:hypothetical protein
LIPIHDNERIADRLWRLEVRPLPAVERWVIIGDEIVNRNFERLRRTAGVGALHVRDQPIVDDRVSVKGAPLWSVREKLRSDTRDRCGIESTAHPDAGAIRSNPVVDGGAQQVAEVIDVVVRPRIADAPVRRECPVPRLTDRARVDDERVRRGKALHVGECRRARVLVEPEQQEVADGALVQRIADRGMEADAIERVAENEGASDAGIVEGLDAEAVAGAEEAAGWSVPDRKREIAEQVIDARVAPGLERVQDQASVALPRDVAMSDRLECRGEVPAIIDTRVGCDPDASVDAAWLLLAG